MKLRIPSLTIAILVAAAGCSSAAHNTAASTAAPATTIVETTTTVIETTTLAPVTTILETTTIAPATTVPPTTASPAPATSCVHSAIVFGDTSRKPEVAALQTAIKGQGFWVGEIDGEFGPNTGDGVAKYFYMVGTSGPISSDMVRANTVWTVDLTVTLPVFQLLGIACPDYNGQDLYGDGTPL